MDVLIAYVLCETCQPTVFALLLGNVYLGQLKSYCLRISGPPVVCCGLTSENRFEVVC